MTSMENIGNIYHLRPDFKFTERDLYSNSRIYQYYMSNPTSSCVYSGKFRWKGVLPPRGNTAPAAFKLQGKSVFLFQDHRNLL